MSSTGPIKGIYKRNEAKDGWMPVCPKCKSPFADGDIGDAKNYPEDGLLAVFFRHDCLAEGGAEVEVMFYYKPYKTTT